MPLRRAILSLGGVGTSVGLDELSMTPFSMIHIKGDGAGEALVDIASSLPLISQGAAAIPVYGNVFKALPGFPMTFGDGTSAETVRIDAGAGDQGDIEFRDGGTLRWKLRKTPGSGFGLERYNASGVLQDEPIGFDSTGGVNFPNTVVMKSRTRWQDPVNETPFETLDTASGRQFSFRFPDPGVDFTASRLFRLAMQDANTTLTMNGDATLNQDVSSAGSPAFVDMLVTGNLTVEGTTTTVNSEQVNIADNHFYMNDGYTGTVAQTGGMIVNNKATGLPDTVATGGFTAGNPSTTNPTVATTGAATYAASDLIQISGASGQSNDGLYEVLSHAANVLTIRGIGVTGRVEDFTQNDFTTDTTVAGNIEKVNVTVNRGGTDGIWETAKGDVTGFVFSDFLTASDIGSTVQADLDVMPQAEAEAGTATIERIVTAERLAQAIAALETGGGGASQWVQDIEMTMGSSTGSYSKLGRSFIYEGSTAVGAIAAAKMAAFKSVAGTNYDLRLQDVTNTLTLAETLGNTNTTIAIIDLGTISNVPTGVALMEWQLRTTGAGIQMTVDTGMVRL